MFIVSQILRGLDRETNATYNLEVRAEDDGPQSRSTTVQYTVTVEDANDNSPQFSASQTTSITVREDQAAGEELLVISATDADTGM